jgi:urease accessory protein
MAPGLQVQLGSQKIEKMTPLADLASTDDKVRRLPQTGRRIDQRLERTRGEARITFLPDASGATRLADLFQSGSGKVKLPRVFAADPEAVFLNTAGGLTGGDQLRFAASVGDCARAVATTQAAERIYRRLSGTATVETRLTVGTGATLAWLPQETIVFDRSSLSRTLTADIAADATFMALEAIVMGRAAMGETVDEATIRDNWRVRREGRLIFADTLRIDGDTVDILSRPATGGGARAFATLLFVAPDAATRLEAVREALAEGTSEAGASAWNGMLVVRAVAGDAKTLRADLVRVIETLRGRPMPRVWNC